MSDSNVLEFPSGRITALETARGLLAAVEAGEVEHVLVATMAPDTSCRTAMSTSPAHVVVYLNTLQRMKIEELMCGKGLLP